MSGEVGEDGGVIAALKALPKAAKITLAAGSVIGSSLALAGLFESFIRFMEERRFKPPGMHRLHGCAGLQGLGRMTRHTRLT